jgi:hypothetical protein
MNWAMLIFCIVMALEVALLGIILGLMAIGDSPVDMFIRAIKKVVKR